MPESDAPGQLQAHRRTILVLGIAAAIDTVVFLIDIQLPAGVVEWIGYLIPVLVCLFAPRPWAPFVAATLSTALMALDLKLSPAGGLSDELARSNRVIGAAAIWLVAVVVSRFIASRNRIETAGWVREGQARLSEAIQGESDREGLAARALSEACRRLGAQVGAMFIANDDAAYALAGGYALSPARVKESPTFDVGEGFVGQVAREKRVMRVSDVPAGYADASSGLGAAAPRELLLAPLTASGSVAGVLELGFTAPPTKICEDYLGTVGEAVGLALQARRYQEHLRQALDKSTLLTEELRQINGELEMRSRELEKSQVRLEEQHAELEQANHQLEVQASTLQKQTQLLEERNDELSRAHEAIAAKATQLERVGHYRSEFLANMSHELRTPLNSALILARLLADNKDRNLTPEQTKYAETIYGAGVDLLNLINDVLDLSKVEAGKMTVLESAFTLADVADGLERTFDPLAKDKGLKLTIAADDRSAELRTDRNLLDQVLKNLVSNAIKFTKRGAVDVRTKVDGGTVAIRVHDTGVGIAPDQVERIFDAFHQVTENGSRPTGTGLGLSIARRFASLMGGVIDVSSARGEGSTFTLRIPRTLPGEARKAPEPKAPIAATAAASTPAVVDAPARAQEPAVTPLAKTPAAIVDDRQRLEPSRRTVLVIEDDERFAFVLYDLVRELEHQCLVATTGSDGLALALEHRPDAVILDMKLPDQSGLSVLDQLKISPRTRHIPVHVLSIMDCTQTAREMGAVSYMLKPARREQLATALSELAGHAKRDVKSVLVVEDNAAQRAAIHALIAQDTVEIASAKTAQEALDLLGRSTFDCVVLDLGLPDLSGFELLEKMAAGERYAHPPVIIYTGRNLSHAEEERLQRYARSIVLKGARSPERLLHEVTLFLHKVEEDLPEAQQRVLADVRTRDRALEGRVVLLVDDDVRNVYAITRVLEEQRARVRIARNGREALDDLDRDPALDLVLMDVMMPVMDGHEAMRLIRAQERFADLPIIALTARAMPDDHDRCLRAGASDYLAKPVQLDKLLALLRVWTGRRRSVFH